MRIGFTATPQVRRVLDGVGRTEDVCFSPGGRRLALAEFAGDRILLFDVDIAASGTLPTVALTGCTTVTCASFREPHGVCFLDEATLVVANRAGGVTLLKLPPEGARAETFDAPALETMGDSRWLHSPGSVAIARVDADRHALLVCNNYADYVSRHVIDARRGFVVTDNEMLLCRGLAVPDGVAVNATNEWIAVSSHGSRDVLLFRNTPQLGRDSQADGVLRRVACPHGVRFTQDDDFVIVADAGAPFLHVYAREGGSWHGERDPVASCRVMDDATFQRGRYNPEEGGPKGIDIDRAMSVVVTTCEHQPLAFFALSALLGARARNAATQRAGPGVERPAVASRNDAGPARVAVSRAGPCPCGSGKRFKQCCGRLEQADVPTAVAQPFVSTMERALSAQRSGELDTADALYREALAMQPDHPDALHMLGVVRYERGRLHDATRLVRRAGEVTQWRLPGVRHNYALVLGSRMLGRSTGRAARVRVEYDAWLAQTVRHDVDEPVRVSVVIAVSDDAAWVERALESVFAQRYRPLELVVVDHGSTDGSADSVQRLLRHCPFPSRFVRQPDLARHAALDHAVALAGGDFVNPLHPDDAFEPGRIDDMVDAVARRGFEWGFGQCVGIDSNGERLRAADGVAARLAEVVDVVRSCDTVGAAFLGRFDPAITYGNLFFSKSLYERAGGFRDCAADRDWDFCLRALRIAEPSFVARTSYRYRVHAGRAHAVSGERDLAEAETRFADYHAGVLEARPANRFAPARHTLGWSCLAPGLAAGQGALMAPERLVRLEAELDAEDERAMRRREGRDGPGVSIVGYFRGDFGLAEAVRGLARSCKGSGIAATFHDADAVLGSRQPSRALDADLSDAMLHRNLLLYVNPDHLKPLWSRLADRGELEGRRVIGYWFWEIDAFPAKWCPALDLVDEIWVATDFIADMIRRETDKPVVKIPHALPHPPVHAHSRADFGLPEDRFLFLFTFDFNSFGVRKNPQAVIEAFTRAFAATDRRAGLVVKCAHGYRFPDQLESLLARANEDPRIVIVDRVLSNAGIAGLQDACDAYVSLHRSEGLGLGMAECMARGKPVVATGYSGNLEFMSPDNSCLVDFTLVPVRPGEYIDYEPGWMWADPDIDHAAAYMARLVDDPAYRNRIATRAAADMARRFNQRATGDALARRLATLAEMHGAAAAGRIARAGG